MAYTTIDDPTLYFNTVLYTGNATARSITGVGFQPDWTWIKGRSFTYNHGLYDSVRGATKRIVSNNTNAEDTRSDALTAFGTDGFSLGSSDNQVNANSATYTSWNWKAGTSFTNDASSTSIGTIDSTGSFNNDSGFSIVSYTGTGSNGTIKHGMNVAPSMIIVKSRNTTSLWGVYHQSLGNTHGLFLNATNSSTSLSAYWNNTSPTSSVFSVGSDADINKSSDPLIAYCFAEKKGYSKFGSYTGNGNADGSYIHLGFSPSFVIVKLTSGSGEHWYVQDATRDTFNPSAKRIKANANDTELDNTAFNIDFLSNGMKMRNTNAGHNGSGSTYIYMAFAEQPFVTSTGIPATAR